MKTTLATLAICMLLTISCDTIDNNDISLV